VAPMRIWVVGTSGAGKTSLARRLSAKLGLPLIELDAINWQSGWRNLNTDDPDEFARRVEAAVAGEGWVVDGNYGSVRPKILARATHLIWLDYDRPVIMARVIRRSIARALDRRELWAGNRETWRHWLRPSHPIRWAWDTWKRRRAQYEAMIDAPAQARLKVLRLRRPRDAAAVEAWLTRPGP
jgi:adenylate kinase family enzyme